MPREYYKHFGLVWVLIVAGCVGWWWLVLYGIWCLVKG